jgi:lysophospholipase L1-like esterase
MIRAWLFFALLSSPLFAADPAPAVAVPVLDIVYLGDSITLGVGVGDRATQAAPVICSAQIMTKLPGVTVFFSNQGNNGHTTVDFLPSSHDDFTRVEEATKKLLADHPGKLVFSMMIGTNDSAVTGTRGAPVSPEQYGKNLTTIVDQLLVDFPRSEFVLQRPIWYSPNTHNGATYEQEGLDRLNSYLPVIKSVIAAEDAVRPGRVHLGDVSAYSYFEKNHLTEQNPEDGVKGIFYLHPNAAGAASLGKFWADGIISGISLTH